MTRPRPTENSVCRRNPYFSHKWIGSLPRPAARSGDQQLRFHARVITEHSLRFGGLPSNVKSAAHSAQRASDDTGPRRASKQGS